MDRGRSLNLIAEIYNQINSKNFISTTCTTHTSNLPIYYCIGCFDNNKKVYC